MKKDDEVAICPFYGSSTPQSLVCEGVLGQSVFTKTKFKSEEARLVYMSNFCNTYCWRGCVIAQAIEEMYKE